jgi:hypothetical protein
VGQSKEPNKGKVRCLVCGNYYDYLTPGHLSSSNCEPGQPTDIGSYRTWVAEEYGIDTDDPIFDPNQIQKPQHYRQHAERLELPK